MRTKGEAVQEREETTNMARINTKTAINVAPDVGPMNFGQENVCWTGVKQNVLLAVIYSMQRRIVQEANLEVKTQEDNLDLPPKWYRYRSDYGRSTSYTRNEKGDRYRGMRIQEIKNSK